MKNLVRGGAILSLMCVLTAIIYAGQAKTEKDLIMTNDSFVKIENTSENNKANNNNSKADDNSKLVKTTGSVRSAGASRGAFSASAYCFSGRTAMGHGVRRGLIAADPRVLPLGSRVYINAGAWSGTYLVSDTGGAIKGKKIDIWVPSCSEARKFGRRSILVTPL